jgi:oligoribonuclease
MNEFKKMLTEDKKWPNMIWLDAETTGLRADQENLLEVACLITDTDLNIIDEDGYSAVVHYPESYVAVLKNNADPFVQQMHETSHLWDRLSEGSYLSQIDKDLVAYMSEYTQPNESVLAGNSITLDRNFMQWHLPGVYNHMYYRSVDVSSIALLAQWWYGEDVKYQKEYKHEAFADIKESIEELKFLRNKVFK